MIIFNKPTVVISYDRERAMLCLRWKGYTPGGEFREAVDAAFEFMTREKIFRILSDVKEQRVVSPNEQDYTKEYAIKIYKETGMLKIAFITRPESLVIACVQRYNRSILKETGIEMSRFFECEEDALTWLMDEGINPAG